MASAKGSRKEVWVALIGAVTSIVTSIGVALITSKQLAPGAANAAVNSRAASLASIEQEVAKARESLGAVEKAAAQLAAMEARVVALERQTASTAKPVAAMESRLGNAEKQSESMAKASAAAAGRVTDIERATQASHAKADAIERRVAAVEGRVRNIQYSDRYETVIKAGPNHLFAIQKDGNLVVYRVDGDGQPIEGNVPWSAGVKR